VKMAMHWASRRYVQIDELMEAVGKRLGELTGAEWGMVTTGGAGALTVATCACVAGADPDKMELLSYRTPAAGLKYDVIIPRTSRNVYDHSIRAVGVRIVEPASMEDLESALGPQTAMVMLLTEARDYGNGPMSIEKVSAAAHKHGIPVLADAAAEMLTVPNVHLKRGADLVSYSGGKCIRGPQCAGLLLGRKDLVQAAWANSAPHHTVCRSLKVGKEEIVGMLAAVEAWMKRDHDAEEKMWTSWLDQIAARLKPIEGLTAAIRPARGIDNRTPTLGLRWDRARIDLTEDELEQILWDGEPRIAIGGKGSFLPFPPDQNKYRRGHALHDDVWRREDCGGTSLPGVLQCAEARLPEEAGGGRRQPERPVGRPPGIRIGQRRPQLHHRTEWQRSRGHSPGASGHARVKRLTRREQRSDSQFVHAAWRPAQFHLHWHGRRRSYAGPLVGWRVWVRALDRQTTRTSVPAWGSAHSGLDFQDSLPKA
jgi:seryl-tRNA(Sec) selenium transferase